ncbi:MAG: hypothetical protein ABIY37_08400 [Devosia sp.]
MGRKIARPMFRETLVALLVVALTFLNFGHVAVTASGEFRITPDSWCGDPLLPDSPEHSPCHACRIGSGADLPPPPSCVETVAFVALAVAYVAPALAFDLPVHARPAQPRGPPALV